MRTFTVGLDRGTMGSLVPFKYLLHVRRMCMCVGRSKVSSTRWRAHAQWSPRVPSNTLVVGLWEGLASHKGMRGSLFFTQLFKEVRHVEW